MASALEKRIAAIEAQRQHTGKRRPECVTRQEDGRLVLSALRFPVGLADWREATAQELAEVQTIMDSLEAEY